MKKDTAGVGHAFKEICEGICSMPDNMKRLAVSQFFTWFGLFCMWIYFIPMVATHFFGGVDGSQEYQQGAEWGGVCFSAYNLVAFFFSFLLLWLVKKYSARYIHACCLSCGALGLLSIYFISNPYMLLLSMAGVGIAWASILSMPYAMLSNSIASDKMGFYMGVFNFFIVLPQILASLALGKMVEMLFDNSSFQVILLGGFSLLLATLSLKFVKENNREAEVSLPIKAKSAEA